MNSIVYIWMGIACMALTTYLVRVIPMLVFRKPVTNPFVQSFLYYVPYAVLSAMTFPAIFSSESPQPAVWAGTLCAVYLAWKGRSLIVVASAAALVVYLVSILL